MKGGCHISSEWIFCLVVAGFLMPQIVTVSAKYSMEQTCAQVSTCHIANPDNCQSFGYCKNGKLMGTASCPDGYIYNARKAICEFPSANGCAFANATNVCKYVADNSHVRDPNTCDHYYYCYDGIGYIQKCPDYQIFDSKRSRCDYGSQVSNKCVIDSVCYLLADGLFAGDPVNCGQFVQCMNGGDTSGKCPENTYYNKQLAGCQQENPCQTPTPAGIGPGIMVALPDNPEACKAATKSEFPQYVSDGRTCVGYHICTSATGSGAWGKCPSGLHFNPDLQECVTPYSFPCMYDRCGNMAQKFVGAVGSDCRNFLICDNETSQGPASGYADFMGLPCSNNQYFDEFSQRCIDKSPASANYTLCP